jgi:mRNA-degrading endonuclease toxin of MazEF toxin-antitoxin module
VVNCDSIATIPKDLLAERIAVLSTAKLAAVNAAIRFALSIS